MSGVIKNLLLEKIYTIARCFQDSFMSQMDAQLVEDFETGFLAKTARRTKEGNQELQSGCTHQCHVEVVRVLFDDAHGKGERVRDLEPRK